MDKDKQRLLRLKMEIIEEISNLQFLIKEISRLIPSLKNTEASTYNLRAAGSIIHDFYNGVENIFRRIAQELNGGLPQGEDWHRQLLIDMSIEIEGVRPPVISKELKDELQEYLGFRHIFRHIYGFSLVRDRISYLAGNLAKITESLEKELSTFYSFLDSLSA